jgi:cytochrome c biogenesis protein ResB
MLSAVRTPHSKLNMNIVIKLLASTKFAVAIIAIIIALAAFGTVYPGGDAIFGSWLFLPFIGLLALSTVTCSLTRIRPLWRAVMHPTLEVDDQFIQQLPYHTTLTGVAISQFKAHLQEYKWYESTSSETTFMFAQKGRVGRFGPHIAHFGVLILLLGVVTGAVFGQANPYNDTIAVIPIGGSQQIDGFVLRLDGFNVSYYDNGAVREYRAIVTIIDGNQVQTHDITINGPINYKGLTFLLYGYDSQGVLESGKASWVAFQIKNDTGIALVWAGAAVSLLGIMLSLYIPHKRVWIKLYKEQITLGAISNKNATRFLRDIDNLCAKLEEHS